MKLKQIIYGVATFIPGVSRLHSIGTGGSDSARYCYSVWLRHLVLAHANGLKVNPAVVAELGPGDSLGIGLAALLCGAERYLAFDVVAHASLERNIDVFEQLVQLFQERASIPTESEFPNAKPVLPSYDFPSEILTEERLSAALEPARIQRIRESLRDWKRPNSMIEYKAPWYRSQVVEDGTVDMVFSQAVLEHVDDVAGTYEAVHAWLKNDGFMSHQIDFKCHGTAKEWNGHWTHSDVVWKLIRGGRPYLLNRQPHSVHLHALDRAGFKVVYDQTMPAESSLSRSDLAPRFRSLEDADLVTSGAFIQAVKK